ncbi:hypothetical protein GLIP_4327 [Aliiglaciecola lipolytica E3]|uniref:Uncharacterized protein n=1 Tax=Aliiglaciecola lipolytica E3 TaxID=1127673 RepID=K6YK01_9ALTE|nr:hypothetical protein GLIP_4327 [Aliiglaciecola lipolytica E3]
MHYIEENLNYCKENPYFATNCVAQLAGLMLKFRGLMAWVS